MREREEKDKEKVSDAEELREKERARETGR